LRLHGQRVTETASIQRHGTNGQSNFTGQHHKNGRTHSYPLGQLARTLIGITLCSVSIHNLYFPRVVNLQSRAPVGRIKGRRSGN